MTESRDDLSRLADALDAYLSRSQLEGTDSAYLHRHPELREFLEPMLDEDQEASSDPGEGPFADEEPSEIGPYRLVREVGRGGMGVVYEAVHGTLGRRVALKVLPAPMSASPRRIERFLREARAVARLEHPNLVAVHEVGEVDRVWFFAMELVDGRNLREELRAIRDRCGRDPRRLGDAPQLGIAGCTTWADEVAEVGAQLADALAHAHAAGLVHRDVKPHNVLIDPVGRPRLVDFGLAKDLADESLTYSGDFAGTPQYSAPEQIDPKGRALDGRADVYGLGVVLYEMLAMRRPIDGASQEEILRAVLGDEPRPLRALAPSVPRDLETVVHRALEKDREQRYPTATDLAEDLRRFRRRAAIQARPVATLRRAARWAARHRASATAIALGFSLFVVAPTVAVIVLEVKNVELRREKERAEGHLDRARRAVDQLFLRVAEEELPEEPRQQEFRRALLADAGAFYEEMFAAEPGDDVLADRVLRARTGLGVLDVELGRYETAVGEFAAAIDALEGRLASDPGDDFAIRLRLAEMLADRAFARRALGEADAEGWRRAEALWAEVIDALPAEHALRRDALGARVRMRLNRVEPTREPTAARGELAAVIADLDGLGEFAWQDERLVADRAWAWILSARVARDAGDLAAADAAVGSASEALARLGVSRRARLLRAQLLREQGAIAERRGRRDDAERGYREALDLQRRLAASFPADDGLRIETAATSRNLAGILLTAGRAVESFEVAIAGEQDIRSVSATARNGIDARRALASLAAMVAMAADQAGELEPSQVEEHFVEAIARYEELTADEPIPSNLSSFGAVLNNLAMHRLRHRSTPPRDLVPLLDRAIGLQRRALAASPAHNTATSFLRIHLGLVAECWMRAGEFRASADAMFEALPLDVSAGQDVYLAAGFARIVQLAAGSDPDLAGRCRDAAVELLGRVDDKDPERLPKLRADRRFAVLADDPDFRRLTGG